MGYLQAQKIARTFNAQQSDFVKTKNLDMSDTVSNWQTFCTRMSEYDTHIDNSRYTTWIFAALTITAAVLTALIAENDDTFGGIKYC